MTALWEVSPSLTPFMDFMPFEHGAGNIADVSAIPGSSQYVAVIERNGFPDGHLFPGAGMPANKVCIVDLTSTDSAMVFDKKKCVLNYHAIADPWDVDGNGIFVYGHTQTTNEALIVVDDYCIVAGTDTNYPWTNQFMLDESQMENWKETTDARFMVVCFQEPIFSTDMLMQHMMMHMMEENNGSSDGSGSGSESDGDLETPPGEDDENSDAVVAQAAIAGSGPNDGRGAGWMMIAMTAAALVMLSI